MTTKHTAALVKSITGLLGDGSYADATIICGERQWKVHKAVVCTRCEFFKKAFDGRFKEAGDSTVTLEDDHPNAVAAMLRYIYSGNYDDMAHRDDVDGDWKALAMNFHVHVIGDKYCLKDLAQQALAKFKGRIGAQAADAPGFLQAITAVYADVEECKTPFQDCLMACVMQNGRVLLARKDFQEIARSVPAFAAALVSETFRLDTLNELEQAAELTAYRCCHCQHEFAVKKTDSEKPGLAEMDGYYCYHCDKWLSCAWWDVEDRAGYIRQI